MLLRRGYVEPDQGAGAVRGAGRVPLQRGSPPPSRSTRRRGLLTRVGGGAPGRGRCCRRLTGRPAWHGAWSRTCPVGAVRERGQGSRAGQLSHRCGNSVPWCAAGEVAGPGHRGVRAWSGPRYPAPGAWRGEEGLGWVQWPPQRPPSAQPPRDTHVGLAILDLRWTRTLNEYSSFSARIVSYIRTAPSRWRATTHEPPVCDLASASTPQDQSQRGLSTRRSMPPRPGKFAVRELAHPKLRPPPLQDMFRRIHARINRRVAVCGGPSANPATPMRQARGRAGVSTPPRAALRM